MSKLQQGSHGAVMVELALLLPLLVLLVFGITEIGRALYQHNTLAKAIESGARYLSRSAGALEIVDNHCNEVVDLWVPAEQQARNLIVFGDEDGKGIDGESLPPLLPYLAVGSVSISVDPDAETATWTSDEGTFTSKPACVIKVEASVPFDTLMGEGRCIAPYLCLPKPIMLNAAVEERWIGE